MFSKIKNSIANKAAVKVYESSIKMFKSIKRNLEQGNFIDEDKLKIETIRLSFISMKKNLAKVYRNDLSKQKNEGLAYDSLVEYCDKIIEGYYSFDISVSIQFLNKMIEFNELMIQEAKGL